ncbi:MAG: type II toxin-antitoxin system VapC family toxin [Actinobacteria bacterium]|nr:type II toxin-antitoxin system VapC family toxin [Actinomycetota bacterium]
MTEYLLDTTIIIDHLRGNKKISSFLEEIGISGDIAGCCCINITETYTGMKDKEKENTDKFIESLYYFEVTKEIAKLAGAMKQEYAKKGKTLSTSDVIIATTALTYGLILITKNIKHYPFNNLKLKEL